MSRTVRFRPTGVIGAMIGVVALAGCGAGQVAQTSSQVAAVGGASANSGAIAIRDAQIEFPDEVAGGDVYAIGGSAPLRMSIVNTGAGADELVSASSPVASSVDITGDKDVPGGLVLVVDGEPAAATPEAPAATPTSSARATTTAPVQTAAPVVDGESQIVLTGLTEDIRAGLTYPLVLTFRNAGEVRVDIPVGNPTTPREDEPAE